MIEVKSKAVVSTWYRSECKFTNSAVAFGLIPRKDIIMHREWLHKNGTGKFHNTGGGHMYFECQEDWVLYKMTWL